MEWIKTAPERVLNVILSLQIMNILDILIIAYMVYQLLMLVRKTNSSRILKGLFVVLLVLWISTLGLNGLNFIMSRIVEYGVMAILILFSSEIRRGLEQMGSSSKFKFLDILSTKPKVDKQAIEQAIVQTVRACGELSRTRTGALIVFERNIQLEEPLRSGTKLDAEVSSELLKNIFFVKAPMHDGAVLVRDGRILGAGCMLPLSRNVNLSRDLGMRHRAGIGMSENSDAVVVLVSEETGTISVAVGGMLKRHLMVETLEVMLRNELLPQEEGEASDRKKRGPWKGLLPKGKKEDEHE